MYAHLEMACWWRSCPVPIFIASPYFIPSKRIASRAFVDSCRAHCIACELYKPITYIFKFWTQDSCKKE